MSTLESREALEAIANQIAWPDEISEILLNSNAGIDHDSKVELLYNAMLEDSEQLRKTYFPESSDGNLTKLFEASMSQDWSVERKVQLGVIDGMDYTGFLFQRGLLAASWGSQAFETTPDSLLRQASRMLPNTEVDFEQLPVMERRRLLMAYDIFDESKDMPTQLISPVLYKHMSHSANRRKDNGEPDEAMESVLGDARSSIRQLSDYIKSLRGAALMLEQDPSGFSFLQSIVDGVANEYVNPKSVQKRYPFTIGKAVGARKTRELYEVRYELLN